MWCIARITPEYRQRMYRLLDLYAEPYNEACPVICIDEKSKQLLEDVRPSIAMKAGSPQKCDYEYKRNGTRNIFVAVEPQGGKRIISVTATRTKTDFAYFVQEVKTQYSKAKEIRIVVDNLNTHFEGSFYEAFTAKRAKAILRNITFVYTPKHASWLNMAEIEINVMDRECLGRKIATEKILKEEIAAWSKQRNEAKQQIVWKFTRQDADNKLSKHYVP